MLFKDRVKCTEVTKVVTQYEVPTFAIDRKTGEPIFKGLSSSDLSEDNRALLLPKLSSVH